MAGEEKGVGGEALALQAEGGAGSGHGGGVRKDTRVRSSVDCGESSSACRAQQVAQDSGPLLLGHADTWADNLRTLGGGRTQEFFFHLQNKCLRQKTMQTYTLQPYIILLYSYKRMQMFLSTPTLT